MSELTPCPLWGGGTERRFSTGDYDIIENRRAGGLYRISRTARVNLRNIRTDELAAKITSWIVDQHRSGDTSPLLTTSVLELIGARPRLTISQQIQRFYLFAIHRRFRANTRIHFGGAFSLTAQDDISDLSAWMECENSSELNAIVRLMQNEGVLVPGEGTIALAPSGVKRLEEAQLTQKHSNQAFVAMWFDPSMDEAYERGFRKAIETARFTPLRIDRKEHNNKIDDEIIAEIRRSKFVVADFTCTLLGKGLKKHSLPRGGVYFEAGFAMGLGIPVIWSCHEDLLDHVHFDTRQFAHVVWSTPDNLRERLLNRIRAVISEAG